jgi:RNA polymerase sigma factor (TIGR02999 family)
MVSIRQQRACQVLSTLQAGRCERMRLSLGMTEAESFDAVYRVLHRLAGKQMRRGGRATLDTTGLVHEAWMKVSSEPREFESHEHFLAVAATAMRQILVDHARRRNARKRGAGLVSVTSLSNLGMPSNIEDVLAIDRALTRLAALDERLTRIVEWRFFAGLDEAEIAEALDVDVRTVRRDWRKARAFILNELGESAE